MTHTRSLLTSAAVVLALTACSSSTALPKAPSATSDSGGAAATTPAGGTSAPIGTFAPTGLGPAADQCLAVFSLYGALLTQAFDPTQQAQAEQTLNELKAKVPPELSADVATVVNAYQQYISAAEKAQSNPADPAFQTAIQALNAPEISAASDRLTAYFDATCPNGG
jgi:hypothetical protein